MKVVVTGGSGAVGSTVCARLVRDGHSVQTVGRTEPPIWDLSRPMTDEAMTALSDSDVVIHAAADVRLNAPAEELARTNVTAVKELVETLEAARKPTRLIHISSAFATPYDDGTHNNPYEVSKAEAETALRCAALDVVCVRPSLVVGDSSTGGIERFSGIYSFLRMLRLGLVPAIPGRADAPVDIVPVDAVADCIVGEVDSPSGESIRWCTAGSKAPTLADIIDLTYDEIQDHVDDVVDRPKFLEPPVYHRLFRPLIVEEFSPAQVVLLETIDVFLPYFEKSRVFPTALDDTVGDLREVWRASVRYWLDRVGIGLRARGREVWAKR